MNITIWIQYLQEIDQLLLLFIICFRDFFFFDISSFSILFPFFFLFFLIHYRDETIRHLHALKRVRSIYVCITREKNNRKIEEIKGNRNGKLFLDEHGPKVEHIRCMMWMESRAYGQRMVRDDRYCFPVLDRQLIFGIAPSLLRTFRGSIISD